MCITDNTGMFDKGMLEDTAQREDGTFRKIDSRVVWRYFPEDGSPVEGDAPTLTELEYTDGYYDYP